MEEGEQRLVEILKLTEKLFSATTHSEMVDVILQRASAVLGCRVCLISLQKGKLVIENGIPFCGHGIGETISQKKGEKFLRGVIDDGHIVTVSDPLDDKRIDYLRPLVERLHISSIIFSPLHCAKGENIGVLVFDALRGKKFSREDAKFVKMISHVAALAIQREVREQKEKLRMLKEVESRALEVNSSVMAHAIRNPLTALGGFVPQIKKILFPHREKMLEILGKRDSEKIETRHDRIISEVERIEHLVSTVLSLAKPAALNLQKTNPNAFLGETVENLKLNHSRRATFASKFDDHLAGINLMIDRYHLQTCIDDLVNNALDAFATKIFVGTKLSKTRCLIMIIDNGDGIDPKDVEDIFVLFMTKNKPNGTGLGLPSVRHIVRSHGGEVVVKKSEKGRTEFEISLPIPGLTQK